MIPLAVHVHFPHPTVPFFSGSKSHLCPKQPPLTPPPVQVKLAIFRTSNGCGWGVKALEAIKRGTFVAEYVGEVITNEEAERRGQKYGASRREGVGTAVWR